MWLFIVSDAITFSAMLVAYSYVRVASPDWPTPFPFYPSIVKATVMTFCLLSSSVTMVMAVRAMKLGDRRFYDYARAFGFGRVTGLPGCFEENGLMSPPEKWDGLTITRMPMVADLRPPRVKP